MAGTAYALIRHLRTLEHPNTIVFYFAFVTLLVSTPFMFVLGFVTPSLFQLIAMFGIGIFGFLSQLALNYAYKYAKANDISIYQYLTILFSAMIGFFLLGEIPDIYSVIGGVLIIISAVGNYYITTKKSF